MPPLSGPTAVAGRVLLSTLWSSEGVDYEEEAVSLLPVRIPDLGHGGNDIAGHPKASAAVVSSHVALTPARSLVSVLWGFKGS